ncbi:hypothetical protein CAEBREN_21176 [Caenorhabditis brenneri]|uniref:Uncharacterized protein n=1 Tax=Caenorhabditis brenneri TaxID=135651 RepID=G0MS32_CAEBE|nr:hypothetical protein CAEBREN_21176 [Caenorhabditis brenneri]
MRLFTETQTMKPMKFGILICFLFHRENSLTNLC